MTAKPISAKTDIVLSKPVLVDGWPEGDVEGIQVTLNFQTDEASVPEVELFANARRDGKKVKITIEVVE